MNAPHFQNMNDFMRVLRAKRLDYFSKKDIFYLPCGLFIILTLQMIEAVQLLLFLLIIRELNK